MKLIVASIILMFIGFLLVFASILSPPYATTQSTSATSSPQFAGLILIGPIPIAFGNVPSSVLGNLVIVGVIFTIILLIIYLIMFIIARKNARFPPPY
ncbi:DUF131 domain-containing protein [Sulfolobus sp. B1]|uniref:TIGR00304 family membrane protein n=1 Tax=Sulfolobaceae TaxID=118883 RepID=UPI0009F53DD1|nr:MULTISPECIES: DUF131 domain-containing protein [unclassified Sulfolobus]TRM78538.1 DUF131 domain-containing protein [Sulfolobus sp. A20-N-F8]TRM79266.1 DUF131 domain-containing protein [Sulfolobus sp. B5]TRM82075.1 DUF131 domain-containing protein [Sulfolobus sp. D5]TRM89829.1 DUF131 domain-containing protein [Sulfolobus sp. C3]TRM95348.1 DUF131 domain-containing protein [Sulfolobus sp. A20-N-G8]TRN02055.1 DUF131 domain-containing protein [Sulfolobus sp. F1]TRN03023.1 DUF131 domain-contai